VERQVRIAVNFASCRRERLRGSFLLCADAFELRKELGDFVSLRDALSAECEQRSIVLPEFPRVRGWFGSPSRHDMRVHRALLEVCRGVVLGVCWSALCGGAVLNGLHRDELRRLYHPLAGVASEGCQSSDAV
jgi:hypothetical protein